MTTTQRNHAPISIDDDVELLTEQIQALKELGRHDHVGEDQVYDLSIRWGIALAGRLRRMEHYSSRGLLNDVDEARFQSLCTELRAVSDLVERFDLSRPALPGG
jgi:hypothetical protein